MRSNKHENVLGILFSLLEASLTTGGVLGDGLRGCVGSRAVPMLSGRATTQSHSFAHSVVSSLAAVQSFQWMPFQSLSQSDPSCV